MYQDEFTDAVRRTKRFNLRCPLIEVVPGKLLTKEQMSQFMIVLRDAIDVRDVEELGDRCLQIHSGLIETVATHFNSPCYFTLGHVELEDRIAFHQSEEDLRKILQNGVNETKKINIHAWLSFPTMEILDITLPTAFAKTNESGQPGRIISDYADKLAKEAITYHPMLVGDDFLMQSGVL